MRKTRERFDNTNLIWALSSIGELTSCKRFSRSPVYTSRAEKRSSDRAMMSRPPGKASFSRRFRIRRRSNKNPFLFLLRISESDTRRNTLRQMPHYHTYNPDRRSRWCLFFTFPKSSLIFSSSDLSPVIVPLQEGHSSQ